MTKRTPHPSIILASGLLLSSVIGAIAFLFLTIEHALIDIIWHQLPHHITHTIWYYGLVVGAATVALIFLKHRWGDLPQTAHDMAHELKAQQTVRYDLVAKSLLVSLVILAAGAGVGPEAPLLGAIIALSIWQMDKLRYLRSAGSSKNLVVGIGRLLHPTKYLQKRRASTPQAVLQKKWFSWLFILNGVISYLILHHMTDQSSFLTTLGQTAWSAHDVLVVPLTLVYCLAVGWAYKRLTRVIMLKVKPLRLSMPLKTIIGGVGIFLVAAYAPVLLFSGQHAMPLIAQMWSSVPAEQLLLLAVIKLAFLHLCLFTGWIGGNIFPVATASVLHGCFVALLLPQFDALTVMLSVAIFTAMSILRGGLVAGIFVSLFFPWQLAPIMALLIIIHLLVERYTNRPTDSVEDGEFDAAAEEITIART